MVLAPGAVKLPLAHLSVRVPWHDTDWTGRVCENPGTNHFCTVLKNVKEEKDAEQETDDRGARWTDLSRDRVPPCVFERGGFMREAAFTIDRDHKYAGGWTKSHAHFTTTPHTMPARSFEATPYRWVMRGDAERLSDIWGIQYDRALEDRADQIIEMRSETTWVQDHRNQLAMLDSFFSAIVPGQSLVFAYAKDVPLLENRPAGGRVLVGAGLVSTVGPVVEWEYSSEGPLRSIMWERAVGHSIVAPSFTEGFLLPYHQLLADPKLRGEDLTRFVAMAPPDAFDEFSYVTELVTHDAAVEALSELGRVVDLLPGVVDGPWHTVSDWIADRMAEAWQQRGPYPGLGAVLSAAGLERGCVIAQRVVQSSLAAEDPWWALEQAIDAASRGEGPIVGLVPRMAKKVWGKLRSAPERYELLRLLSRFGFTVEQCRRLISADTRVLAGRVVSDAEILENPYLLYELDRREVDGVTLSAVDRGLFPRSDGARGAHDLHPLPDPVVEAADDRRVRSACIHLLEAAAAEGHTLLDEPRLRKRLGNLKLDPVCDPTDDLFEIATDGFDPALLPTPLADGGRGWQLDRLALAGDTIAESVAERIALGPIDVTWDWAGAVDAAIDEPMDEADPEEQAARAEKAAALRILARSRVSALVGPAGTGKTTMLRALCSQPAIHGRALLLAPTGKARVQLGDKAGEKAVTLASFLRKSGRWDEQLGYRTVPGASRTGAYSTVIVDEASMLTEEMLAALLDAVTGVDRLILCGDHRQLPPIGAGRPFADLVRHLSDQAAVAVGADGDQMESGGGIACLTVSRRQRRSASGATGAGRDDLAVAAFFATDSDHPAADEALARVLSGKGDGSLVVRSWEAESDLHRLVVDALAEEFPGLGEGGSDGLKKSLGADATYNGRTSFTLGKGGAGAERWQLLSPVRARDGGVAGLNRLVRRTWRRLDATQARKSHKLPSPMGADEILYHDKVMVVRNHHRKAERIADRQSVSGEVANGEIGIATLWAGNKGLKIELSTQPGLHFTFWESDLNGDRERAGLEELELAYAVTVHKAQGSQFGVTFVVVPNPCPLLSPELLYTALTRHQERCYLLVQGDPAELRRVAGPLQSEAGRRLTRLFKLPSPFETPEGRLFDGSHVHRTANGELVISKSEVIVANTLRGLGCEYLYEEPLIMDDGTWRLPDFALHRAGRPTVYWEHLGMLDRAGYRADWEAKKRWYAVHGVLPFSDGGGPNGTLVWSTEGQDHPGIDAAAIEELARQVMA